MGLGPMDTNSLLVLIIGLLTLNLLFVGVYIVLVLKEVRESIRKINLVLDQVAKVSESVSAPIVGASGMLTGLLEGLKIFSRFKSLRKEASGPPKPRALGAKGGER